MTEPMTGERLAEIREALTLQQTVLRLPRTTQWMARELLVEVDRLLGVVQDFQAVPQPFMVLPYVEVTEEEARQAEQALDEALKKPYELRVAPPLQERLNAGSYTISTTHIWELDRSWVLVRHTPCQQLVFGGDGDDPDELDGATLLKLITAHRCDNAT